MKQDRSEEHVDLVVTGQAGFEVLDRLAEARAQLGQAPGSEEDEIDVTPEKEKVTEGEPQP